MSGTPALNDARAAAARIIVEVSVRGRSLDAALAESLARAPQLAASAALIQELVYGTLRWYQQLDGIARLWLRRAPRARDADVHALLLLGLYQLRAMRVPPHAAVQATVEAASALGKPWAKDLLNACLRGYLREPERANALLATHAALRLSHPAWLLAELERAYPADWAAIAAANNAHAPLSLRVNLARTTRAAYLAQLAAAGLAAQASAVCGSAVSLQAPCPVEALPGFAHGLVSVQDVAAQFAAPLLAARAGERVLDACAAPGGKTTHLLEHTPGIELVALEQDAARAALIHANLARLKLHATVQVADATAPARWWDGRPFARILLDAPCSATGVIRRHPDIKLRRKPEDLARLAQTQARLLAQLWPLLQRGGKLLYVTCSVLPRENEERIAAFLAHTADAAACALELPYGHARRVGWQLLPGEHDNDGFYYACLAKR